MFFFAMHKKQYAVLCKLISWIPGIYDWQKHVLNAEI